MDKGTIQFRYSVHANSFFPSIPPLFPTFKSYAKKLSKNRLPFTLEKPVVYGY